MNIWPFIDEKCTTGFLTTEDLLVGCPDAIEKALAIMLYSSIGVTFFLILTLFIYSKYKNVK